MYERRTMNRKNIMTLFNQSGLPNLMSDGNFNSGSQVPGAWGGAQGQVPPYNQVAYGNPPMYGQQVYPPSGYQQAGYGPPPYGPIGGYGINPLGAGLIGLGLGFLGGQIVNTPFPFKGPHKRYYYYM